MRACRPARVAAEVTSDSRSLQQPHQQRLLRVQPVLGFVPHRAVRPVDHVIGDLVSSVRWKTVQNNHIRLRSVDETGVDLERFERAHPVEPVVLLTHRRPRVGDEHVGAVNGRFRIGRDRHRGARVGGTFLGGRDKPRVGLETGGGGDGDMNAGGDPAQHQRVRHVVGTVAEVRQPQAVQCADALVERLQIGQHLAGVELVGERIDDRHGRPRSHGGQPVLSERPPDDRLDVSRQDPPGVLAAFRRDRAACCGRRPRPRGHRVERCPSRTRTACASSSCRRSRRRHVDRRAGGG